MEKAGLEREAKQFAYEISKTGIDKKEPQNTDNT
jgi:hypothetical protein